MAGAAVRGLEAAVLMAMAPKSAVLSSPLVGSVLFVHGGVGARVERVVVVFVRLRVPVIRCLVLSHLHRVRLQTRRRQL